MDCHTQAMDCHTGYELSQGYRLFHTTTHQKLENLQVLEEHTVSMLQVQGQQGTRDRLRRRGRGGGDRGRETTGIWGRQRQQQKGRGNKGCKMPGHPGECRVANHLVFCGTFPHLGCLTHVLPPTGAGCQMSRFFLLTDNNTGKRTYKSRASLIC